MKRLERGSGDEREFWEISVRKKKRMVRVRSGLATTMGRTAVIQYESEELAMQAMERAIAEKIAEGDWSEPDQHRLAADCEDGVSLSDPNLEALILTDPSAVEPYLVYGDWLLQRHDPRGELINVQTKLAQHPASVDFRRMEDQLLRRFSDTLLGEALGALRASNPRSALRWRHGFLQSVRCVPSGRGMADERLVRGVLSHPSTKFLEHLVITLAFGTPSADIFQAIDDLAPRTLQSLAVGDRAYDRLDLDRLWLLLEHHPTITTLTLVSRMDRYQVPNPPVRHVERLRLAEIDRPALESLSQKEWSSVTDLSINLRHPPRVRGYTATGEPSPPPPTVPFVTLLPAAFPRVERITFAIEPHYTRTQSYDAEVAAIEEDMAAAAKLKNARLEKGAAFPEHVLDVILR